MFQKMIDRSIRCVDLADDVRDLIQLVVGRTLEDVLDHHGVGDVVHGSVRALDLERDLRKILFLEEGAKVSDAHGVSSR